MIRVDDVLGAYAETETPRRTMTIIADGPYGAWDFTPRGPMHNVRVVVSSDGVVTPINSGFLIRHLDDHDTLMLNRHLQPGDVVEVTWDPEE